MGSDCAAWQPGWVHSHWFMPRAGQSVAARIHICGCESSGKVALAKLLTTRAKRAGLSHNGEWRPEKMASFGLPGCSSGVTLRNGSRKSRNGFSG